MHLEAAADHPVYPETESVKTGSGSGGPAFFVCLCTAAASVRKRNADHSGTAFRPLL